MFREMAKRRYELRQRAARQAETRQRIVEAVAALHREIGPARATISAIAERAGVERLTVYRHFGDEAELFRACSAHFRASVPPPDRAAWQSTRDPAERLRAALLAFYAYYRRGEPMIANVRRDAREMPALAAVIAPGRDSIREVIRDLAAAWRARGRQRKRVDAAIAHALEFDTWRSLVRGQGLNDAEAAELMIDLARVSASGARSGKRSA